MQTSICVKRVAKTYTFTRCSDSLQRTGTGPVIDVDCRTKRLPVLATRDINHARPKHPIG